MHAKIETRIQAALLGLCLSLRAAAGTLDPSAMPLMDMTGGQLYLGAFPGLLYDAGDTLPAGSQHDIDGLSFASKVVPLDKDGNPSATGKIVVITPGMSNWHIETCEGQPGATDTACSSNSFLGQVSASTQVDHANLVVVGCGIDGQDAKRWVDNSFSNYTTCDSRLASAGLTQGANGKYNQVQVVLWKNGDISPTVSLAATTVCSSASTVDACVYEKNVGKVARFVKSYYPNVQQMFVHTRIYAGYTTQTLNPEPYAYEYGFANKWLVAAQIHQISGSGVDSTAGDLSYSVAPWIAWGPYFWADGTTPRSDGLVWCNAQTGPPCNGEQDYNTDLTHPGPAGATKVVNMMMNFYLASPYSPWFRPAGSATNPVPALTSIAPSSATAGSAAFTLTANGSSFISGSQVQWNGAALTTTFVSATQLTASVPAASIASSGTASVTVFNPIPGGGTSSALTFTINGAGGSAPVITSALTATGTAGNAFNYQITATNNPASYSAAGLSAGLTVSTTTGLISGTPTAAETSNVTISATNSTGTGSATLVLTVNAATSQPPVITSALTATGTTGTAFNYQITASNSPTSYGATGLPAGLTVDTNTGLISGTPTTAATSNVTISATNSAGTGTATLTLTVNAGGSAGGAAGAPRVYFSDLAYGPSTGNSDTSLGQTSGQDGVIVSVWGNNLGTAQGNSQIFAGGAQAAKVYYWGNAVPPYSPATLNNAYTNMQVVILQVSHLAASGAGDIHVVVNGTTSNAIPFTVQAGNIYFVKTTGSDSTGNGSWSSPWATILKAKNTIAPGDVAYIGDGVNQTTLDAFGGAVNLNTSGAAGNNKMLVTYPGASSTIGSTTLDAIRKWQGGTVGYSQYWTIAKFTLLGSAGPLPGDQGFRMVGNLVSAPSGTGQTGCVGAQGNDVYFLGNEFTQCGGSEAAGVASHYYHVMYISGHRASTGARLPTESNRDIGWNYFHDNGANRAINIYSEQASAAYIQNHKVHDNVIVDQHGDGILIGRLVTSTNWVYNNLVIRGGAGPGFTDQDSFHACIRINAGDSSFASTATIISVYNNTTYGCGWAGGIGSSNFMFVTMSDFTLDFKNNIAVSTGQPYVGGTEAPPPAQDYSLWFGNGAAPAWDTNALNADPLFVNAAGSNLQLQSASPAIDKGASSVGSVVLTDLDGTIRPQGAGYDIGAFEYASGSGSTIQTPVITSALTAAGTVGAAFSYQIAATNSPTSFGATGLPAGLTVNTTSGLISGTPTTAGTSNVTISATNSAGAGSTTMVVTISSAGGSAPVITSALTATGTAGNAFNYQITATNNPASYSAAGLPAGLTVSTTTGLISGTPTAAGTSNVTISATNSTGTGSATLVLTVNAATSQPPVITSALTATGTTGTAFNYQITASNSPTSYGATGLPAGLTVDTNTGLISGTPTTAGTSSVSLSATNSAGTGSATLTLTVNSGGGGGGSAAGPNIFFTDLISGPNTGGENNNGSIVTIYGKRFGATQGTASVTIGGGTAAKYYVWSDTKVVVAIGAAAATGNIVVTVNGAASNGVAFTVRSGNIFCVSTAGSDANSGAFPSSCWASIVHAKNTIAAGDIAYVEDGVTQSALDGDNASLDIRNVSGTAGNPKALVAYPGAKATIGNGTAIRGINSPSAGPSSYWVIAGFSILGPTSASATNPGSGIAINVAGTTVISDWRVIGNDISCPIDNCTAGGSSSIDSVKFFGNIVHDVGATVNNSKLMHALYFGKNSNNMDVGWNQVYNVQACRGILFHSTSGSNQYGLHVHDNLLHDIRCNAIDFSTIDPSLGTVEAYNNVMYHVGTGPDFGTTSSNYTCLYVEGETSELVAGTPAASGNVEVYNNTCYDAGSGGTGGSNALFSRGSTQPALFLHLRNNIGYSISAEPYLSGTLANITGDTNLWFGNGNGPTQTTNNVNADPQVVSTVNKDFHLQSTSPAKDGGLVITGLATDFDYITRPQSVDGKYALGAYEFPSGVTTLQPPVITSALTATGTVAAAFSYQIAATNSPTSFGATGLPAGLTVNTTSGLISGTPTTAGTSNVTISATNSAGAGSTTMVVTISSAGGSGAPVITSALTATGTAGNAFNYQITATNNPASYSAAGLPAGLTVSTTTGLISGTPTAAGTSNVTISATNSTGTGSATLVLTIDNAADTTPPTLAITAPANNATVSPAAAIAIKGTAADDVAVSKVEVSVDEGAYSLATGTASWTFSLNAAPLSASTHTITAKATDSAGNTATTAVTIKVGGTRVLLSLSASGVTTVAVAPSQANLVVQSDDPAFPSAASLSASVSLPSGNKTLALLQLSATSYYATISSSVFSAADFAMSGATLTVAIATQSFSAAGSGNAVTPQLGGVITAQSGSAVIIAAAGVTQDAQITINSMPVDVTGARSTALKKQNLILLGSGQDIVFASSGALNSATLVLPFDPTSIPAGRSVSDVRIAYFNVNTGAWEIAGNATAAGNTVSAGVAHFSPWAPVLLMPDATPGLRDSYVYPNPAVGGQTPVIRASLGVVDAMEVTIFDVSGRKVHDAAVSGAPTGIAGGDYYYDYPWSGAIASGVYFAVVHGHAADGSIVKARTKFAVVR